MQRYCTKLWTIPVIRSSIAIRVHLPAQVQDVGWSVVKVLVAVFEHRLYQQLEPEMSGVG